MAVKTPIHEMKNGLVVMQAETGLPVFSNNNANSDWKLTGQFKDDKGDGVLLWVGPNLTGPSNAGQPQTAPLEYKFEVDEPGTYYIALRTIRPETGAANDRNNDFFIRVEDEPYQKIFFSGPRDEYRWAAKFDPGHGKTKIDSTFQVTQKMINDNDGVFTLNLAGRSEFAGIDEIHINKGSFDRDDDAPTSKFVSGSANDNTPPPPPPEPDDEPADPPPPPPPPPPPETDPDEGEGDSGDAGQIAFTLIDAETDAAIGLLKEGTIVDLSDLGAEGFSISAEIEGLPVESVRLIFDGETSRIENVEPYALFGDKGGDFAGRELLVGTHTIQAEFYAGANGEGALLGTSALTFEAVAEVAEPVDPPEPPEADSLFGYLFVDTADDTPLLPFQNGDRFPTNGEDLQDLSFAVIPLFDDAESVEIIFNGASRIESVEPYAAFGDKNGDFFSGPFLNGQNELTVRAYSEDGGLGDLLAEDKLVFEFSPVDDWIVS